MTDSAKTLLDKLLTLSQNDRAAIAAALLNSLQRPIDPEVDTAWRDEVARRIAALDAGEVETIPWEDVRERLCAHLNAKRST